MKRFFSVLFLFLAGFVFAAEIDWDDAQELYPGVRYAHFELEEPRLMKVFLVRVDLKTPGLYLKATEADPEIGKPMPDYPEMNIITKRLSTGNFMKESRESGTDMVFAVNASPWVPWTDPFTHKYARPSGLQITQGNVINNEPYTTVFAVYKDGSAFITSYKIPEDCYGRIQIALSGFYQPLKNGEKFHIDDTALHPRTAYGLSRDKRYLFVLVIDGRRKDWSLGANANDLADWMLKAGAWDAVNMDGGGSSTLGYWDGEENKFVLLNRPTKSGYQRPNANNLGICYKEK